MKVVTVHRSARDGYQVARGLHEAGLLEALVTDLYWPADRRWAHAFEQVVPRGARGSLRARYADGLPSRHVMERRTSGLASLAAGKIRHLPFPWRRDLVRWCDRDLGKTAGEIASERDAALLSYSYYGHSAFSRYTGRHPRILFQLHPHPSSVREILRLEREIHPDCAASLNSEWELALPEDEFKRLAEEPAMADYWIAASQFTRSTLCAAGIPAERIAVVPYGIDLERFHPPETPRSAAGPLKLLFVGTISQRKGIKYLLEALDLLPPRMVELTVCGRPVDGLELFRNTRFPIHLHPSIGAEGLLEAYRTADVFVFPSLAEGFAQVLLEALASGLPVIATTSTAAPELIDHGAQGYLVKPGDVFGLAAHIEGFMRHPESVRAMGTAARDRAEYFTWERFRRGIADSVRGILAGSGIQTPVCSES